MKEFETYFSSDIIVTYLCKLRAKVANTRNKKHLIHLLTDSEKFNYHVKDSEKYFMTSRPTGAPSDMQSETPQTH